MTSRIGYIAMNTADLDWSDGSELLELPKGVQVKVLVDDPDTNLSTFLLRLPPGYHEPAHAHGGTHATLVLDGKMVVAGTTLGPDDCCYGPNDVVHGSVDYPAGCLLFEIFQGDPARVAPAAVPPARGQAADPAKTGGIGFLALHCSEVPWQEGSQYNKLPPGTETKLLVDDRARDLRVWMNRFVPGYHEPRHVHGGAAPGTVLWGRQIVEGKTLQRGDFRYSPPWLEHGPFDYPESCGVFSMFQGDLAHRY